MASHVLCFLNVSSSVSPVFSQHVECGVQCEHCSMKHVVFSQRVHRCVQRPVLSQCAQCGMEHVLSSPFVQCKMNQSVFPEHVQCSTKHTVLSPCVLCNMKRPMLFIYVYNGVCSIQ